MQGRRGAVMTKRMLVVLAVVLAVAAGCAVAATRSGLWPGGAVAQAPRQNAPRAVPVEVVTATKKVVPVRIEALGSVTPIASVAIKPRVDSEITGVHFRDGVMVQQGDLLFTLDSRAIDWFFDNYLPEGADRRDPRLSPLHAADVRGHGCAAGDCVGSGWDYRL